VSSALSGNNNNNNNPICKAPECQKTSVALKDFRGAKDFRGTGTFRAQDLSFPRTNSPYGELSFRRLFVPGNESSLELSFPRLFVLRNFRSQGTKVPGNFRSLDLSFRGTFVPPTILQGIGYERRQLYQLPEFVS